MNRHLAACPQRQALVARAEQASRKPEQIYQLRVQDAYDGNFWLDLEARGSAKLADLDPHDDYGEPIELVNSPRLGMCGYTGPADPPY